MLPQVLNGVVIANFQIYHYITETVQASAKVTIECEYEVICNLSHGFIFNNLE